MNILRRDTPIAGKKIVQMGLGLNGGGLGLAKYLAPRCGSLLITDLKSESELQPSLRELTRFENIAYRLGEHRIDDFTSADIVFKGAGIKYGNEFISAALKAGVPVDTDIGYFFELVGGPTIGITGSKGKSTTTALLHELVKSVWPGSRVGGNITLSPMDGLEGYDGVSPFVLELSSWQLADLAMHGLSPKIAVLTTIIPDHLNYYGTMENYFEDKKKIYRYQSARDRLILNVDNKYLGELLEGHAIDRPTAGLLLVSTSVGEDITFEPSTLVKLAQAKGALSAVTAHGGRIYWSEINREQLEHPDFTAASSGRPPNAAGSIISHGPFSVREERVDEESGRSFSIEWPENKALPGRHNVPNMLCAFAGALSAGIDPAVAVTAMAGFGGVPYRMEMVRELNGVVWINDTTATIPAAVAATVSSYGKKVVLIAGGVDKGLPVGEMADAIAAFVRKLYLFEGSGSEILATELAKKGLTVPETRYSTMDSVIAAAASEAVPGDIVILSPGFASFNLFVNEFQRGDLFNEAVRGLS